MILTTLLFGAAVIAGIGLLAEFWNDITAWLRKAVNKVKEVVGRISFGVRVFVKKIQEGLKEISKHYSKTGTEWEETVVTRKIPESQVPDEIKAKAYSYKETDITEELELQLAG